MKTQQSFRLSRVLVFFFVGAIFVTCTLGFSFVVRGETTPQVCTEYLPDSFNATSINGRLWKNGITLKIKFIGGDTVQQEKVKRYAQVWNEFANVHFKFVESGESEVRISFEQGRSWSYVGNSAKQKGEKATMNFGWLTEKTEEDESRRVILHEFGHLLGLVHEHQSPKADIDWDRDAVYRYYERYWSPKKVAGNIFLKYSRAQTNYTAYDPESIMHYRIPAEWLRSGTPVELHTVLSKMDKDFIREKYPYNKIGKLGDLWANATKRYSLPHFYLT